MTDPNGHNSFKADIFAYFYGHGWRANVIENTFRDTTYSTIPILPCTSPMEYECL